MHRALTGACALAWCALLAAAPAPWPSAEQQLLHNARFWEAHQRGDLARLALKKLVAARPDRPEPLVELGELDLRLNDFQAATEVETELQRRFAGRAESADFATALRVATRDRLRLASVRRLLELHRTGEMRAELIRLFPAGPPGGALGIEYALLLARTPGGLAAARAYLSRLAAVHPGDPRYQLAIAQLMVRDPSTALAGVTLLEQLRRRDDVRSDDADQLLAAGLVQLGAGKAPEPTLKAYLARNPADSELVALRRTQQRLVEERQLQSAADTAHVLPLLQRRVARDLATGAVPGAAQMAVRAWLERSQASLAARQERRASAELRAALSLQRAQEDMAIASARELDALGYPDEADALLAAAIQRSPGSDWLFETRVRGLIAAGDPGLALVLLHERPLRGKWTAPSRDALRSGALQARADAEAKAGRTDAAIAALEVAVRLTPRDPWLRYRLAGYYNARGEAGLGRELMAGGAAAAPDLAEMSYAQALYLSHLEAYGEALAALDRVPEPQRTEGMRSLYARMEVADARVAARRLVAAGELTAARARLLALEPLAAHSFERARDLAYAWIELGESEHGVALMEPYLAGSPKAEVLLAAAQVLNSAEDDTRLRPLLARLRAAGDLDAPGQAELRRLQRGFDLREVRASERRHDYAQAAHRLDELLALEPRDRT
ncbi:MAG: hypothetical protein JOZ03_09105, partial [Gammaproteobacteria bacterium]|nr:hypothetical protein [Gammaproteobacteria bacterium]